MGGDPRLGTELAGYSLDAILGRGGMSVVYLATQAFPSRKVALKVLAPELASDPDFRERFVRESNAAASLDHPNVVPIYAAGESDGVLYLATRYVEGEDLGVMLAREGSLAPARAGSILEQVASALDAAHSRGILHRDVKPGNVLVASGPEVAEHAYLTDFGLAKLVEAESALTRTGQFMGTLNYAAPEQIVGTNVDRRADVYSLGCVAYHCLTGDYPFARDSEAAVVYAHLSQDPPRASERRPELPAGLDGVIAKAMAKDPEERHPTAGEFVGALQAALSVPAGAGSTPPPRPESHGGRAATTVFIGRDRELEELLGGLHEAEAGRGRLFFLAGEPGIGKSRLAGELATRAGEQGARVVWGRCWEDGGAPAFWPWIQCLRSYLRDAEGEAEPELDADGTGLLAELVPELGRGTPPPSTPALEPRAARFRLFDAVTSFLLEAGRSRPLLVVLDDLHAADAPSLALLTHASRAIEEGPVMMLGCYRDTELGPGHPLTSALGDIARQGAASPISLGGLSGDEVARYLEAETGSPADASVVELVQRQAEGNPLFVGEVARVLLRQEDVPARAPLPRGVGQAIERRLGLISPRCRELLTAASAFGRDVELVPLARLVQPDREEALKLLDEAVRARLLEEVPEGMGRWRFAHGLVRDALYAQLAPSDRMRLHGRVGSVLEALYASDPEPHLAEIAHHFVRAAPVGDPARAVDYARRAGNRALHLLAHEEAARLFETALGALDLQEQVDPAERCDLLLALGEARSRAGQRPAYKEAFLGAADVARRHGMAERLAAAALGYGGRAVWARPGGDAHLIPLLEEGLEAVGDADQVLRARLLARLAGALRDEPSPQRRDRLSTDAVELARRTGDIGALAWALAARRLVLWGPGEPDEALAVCDELVRLAQESRDPERIVEAHTLRLESRLTVGDMAGVREDIARAAGAADALPLPSVRWHILIHRSELALLEGRFDDAEGLVAQGRDETSWDETGDAWGGLVAQEFILFKERGRVADIVHELEKVAQQDPGSRPLFRCLFADALAELGRDGESRAAFESLAVGDFAGIPRDVAWMLSIALLCGVAAALGDAPRAERLHELLSPFEELNVIGPHEFSAGAAARYLGLADEALGRHEEALDHLERALRMNERMGARPWIAHTQHDLARLLLGTGDPEDPEDRERAAGLVAEALATARELGMTALEGKLAVLLDVEPAARKPDRAQKRSIFRREGEYWSIAFEGDAFRLHDSKGLHYLARLLAAPGRETHALDLVGGEEGSEPERAAIGDAGEVLDTRAKAAYRRRLDELREELEEAESWNDPERAARAREEMEFLARELAGAVGLGGRDRRAASAAERARVNVTRAIKAALGRIAEHSPALGRHLDTTIRTGTFCSYSPDPRVPVNWQL